MSTPVDTLGPSAMAAWLRETAANTRRHREQPMLTAKEMNVAPHVAFRLEQAAELIGKLHGLVEAIEDLAAHNITGCGTCTTIINTIRAASTRNG